MRMAMGILALALGLQGCAAGMDGDRRSHLTLATTHTGEAVEHAKEGHAYALVQHAQVALQHAEALQKELKNNQDLQEGIKQLNVAILSGKSDDVVEGAQSAEDALRHLRVIPKEEPVKSSDAR